MQDKRPMSRDPPLWAQLGVTASLFCQRRTRVRHWQKSSLFLNLHPKSGAAGKSMGNLGETHGLTASAFSLHNLGRSRHCIFVGEFSWDQHELVASVGLPCPKPD